LLYQAIGTGAFNFMPENEPKLIKIADVFHPHGIKGEVELRLLNDNHDESVLDEGMTVHLFPLNEKSTLSPKGEAWQIIKLRFGNKVICQFKGVVDRTHLEKLLPFEIRVPRDEFPDTDDNEVYLVDLVDWDIISLEGEKLGHLEGFSDNGMQYLFEVRLRDGSRMTLPYVDAFFPKINTEDKTITMVMPEYTE
jgi:16S rRNA processing protein RimM